jgi:hypothetical protein
MSGFALRIAIDTPVVLNNLLHLDGLLERLLASRGDDPANVSLRRIDQVYCASAALLETGPFGAVENRWTRVKRMRGENDYGIKSDRRLTQIDAMSPFRPKLTDHKLFESVSAIWFCGQGNHARIAEVLRDLTSLGSMASSGYGRVLEWEIMGLGKSDDHGLLLQNGLPARAVPMTLWRRLDWPQHPRAIITQQSYRPPYWAASQEICIAPLLNDLVGTRAEISGLIGLRGTGDRPRKIVNCA